VHLAASASGDDKGFLSDLLHDPRKVVWQEALNGLVAIGGREAEQALGEAKMKLSASASTVAEWIDEALEQVRRRLS
jgi:hypothetical protein